MKFIPNSVTQAVGRQVLTAKANSPHVFFVGGVIGVLGGTYLACKATLKLSDTLDEIHEDVESVKGINEDGKYSDQGEYYRDLGYVYGQAAYKVGKLYAPAIATQALSIAALTGSHVQLTRRNTALMAALGTVHRAYNDYRERVREEFGEEKELDIYHSVENKVAPMPDGTKASVKVADPSKWSPYAKFFDESNPNWTKDPEVNRLFIQAQQNYLNHKLQARGYVLLNEAYDQLGIEHSRAGCVVGWAIGPDGDNYIDFGMFDAYSRDFVNGNERSILLDFNVDGVIYDKLGD